MTTAISLRQVSVQINGNSILENISFDVPVGATTAIIGPNGAGKSVLLKTILNQIPASSGTIEIYNTPVRQYRKVAYRISYIPQKIALDTNFPLTVEGLFSLKSKRWLGLSRTDRERMNRLLQRAGFRSAASVKLNTLSGGQLQRVLIAYSLMDKPELIIMDEPSAGIDVQGQETIYELLKHLQEEQNLTLLLVSHELDIVIRYAKQVICLNRELLCAGVPHKVLSDETLERMYGTPVAHHIHMGQTPHDHTH